MAFSPDGWIGKQEKNLIKKDKDVSLEKMAEGYKDRLESVFSTPAAPAIRNEINTYADAIISSEGEQQEKELDKLVGALGVYKIFGDISDDPRERMAFALALVKREKGLQ